ncbi:MAG TPA: hypothetical protein VMI54_31150 [Polyangiaceae bacterium]|nr:hypothetical protein [Polyangiaceae bacterium]
MRLMSWAAIAVPTFALAALVSTPASAEKSGADKPAKGGGGPGSVSKKIALSPEGLKFGMGLEAIAHLYDKVLDDEYLPLYKKASPGPETEALDAEIKQRKAELRRSRVDFGQTPTGVDQTAMKGEYSYANGESMARMTLRSGTERYFFFFNDRLWKVYDEHKLKKGSALGEDYASAIKVLTSKFGAPPKKVPANPDKDQYFDESVWTTPDMVIRALNRDSILGVVYADREVQEDLPKRRRNHLKNETAMDPDVANALKKSDAPPGPPTKDKGGSSDKKGGSGGSKKK